MFYESLGSLLGQAGDVLLADRQGAPMDAREEREVRQIGVLLRRTRGIWPKLSMTLIGEVEILSAGLAEVAPLLEQQGLEVPRLSQGGDPLAAHRALERAYDEIVAWLVERSDEQWAVALLGTIRSHLSKAADLQGCLVDEMLSIR